ncbi:hypothetical protein [Lysobacter panacisoli]|uniref:Uncharacterized protein n=1 Tax=Lysobacter panacisoli TaxID=1255263 RepID=A0ABP9LSE4_9GAMM|nr:hypothetical protein [Lysobacter panacisoli]
MPYRSIAVLALCAFAVPAALAQPGDAHGIRVRAACYQATPAPRLIIDLSCEHAMDCWRDPATIGVIDLETGKRVSSSANDLVYVDANGALLVEPPMQGVIRAVWTVGLGDAVLPKRVQLVQGDETATSAFEPAADCAALPPAAVRRLLGR